MKKRTKIQVAILLGFFLSQMFFIFIVFRTQVVVAPSDVDKITSGDYAGNYLVTDGDSTIKIIDFEKRKVLWQTDYPGFFCHEADMMPDGKSIIIADTGYDRVIEVNISNDEIIWEWYAKNITTDTFSDYLNWTEFGLNQSWDEEALTIVEDLSPASGYYTHLNTVQFINGSEYNRTYDSILISLRNLDIIIEVNYTAQLGEPGYMNITWIYGVPGDPSIINHGHAPKRWKMPAGHEGHTTICDSENDRVIEIDENKIVVWEYTNLKWPRDCEILPNGNYLILDTDNKRVIEVTHDTKEIVKTFSRFLFNPYEVEYDPEKRQVIVGNLMQNCILIFDYDTGKLEDVIGVPFFFTALITLFLIVIVYHTVDACYKWRKMKGKTIKERLRSPEIYKNIISIGILLGLTCLFYYFLSFLWHFCLHHLIENVPRPAP